MAEIAKLRSESASKDLDIVTLQRRKNELKEDREMLNIALDSKQQELELIKRKYGINGRMKVGHANANANGTGTGATPLGVSSRVNEIPGHPILSIHTPAPSTLNGPAQGKNRRRSSALYQMDFITPSLVNGEKRALRSSAMLASATTGKNAVRERGQENTERYGSLRRQRMMA